MRSFQQLAESQDAPAQPLPGLAIPARREPAASAAVATVAAESSRPIEDTVRIPLSKLEAQLFEAEGLLVAKLATAQRSTEIQELMRWLHDWRTAWTVAEPQQRFLRSARIPLSEERRSERARMDRILDFFSWCDTAARDLERKLIEMNRAVRYDHETVRKAVDSVLGGTKNLLLLPFATITGAFPRLVRDLCRAQNKEADLVITGEQVEMEKRVLEQVKDPLIQMLRNAVAHAMEPPEVRRRQGKSPRGTIRLSVSQVDGSRVQIDVADDGAGISLERVKSEAIRRGMLAPDEAAGMDEASAYALLFRSELSTGAEVTAVSGRGIGLTIVQQNVRQLGGEVSIDSEAGSGTRFRIVLPAIRAAFRGLLCEVAGHILVLPLERIERVMLIRPHQVRTLDGRAAIRMGEQTIPMLRLEEVLELAAAPPAEAPESLQAVLLNGAGITVAFAVDRVLEEQEVLVKTFRKPLVRVRNVAAAALLGSGKVAPILRVDDLLKSAMRVMASGARMPALDRPPSDAARKSILVAEDSITSRLLLKTILEAAGHEVEAVVDGIEALSLLRSKSFDLLVSDVEMPGLDGFELTARIRADSRLASLPVVLVTTLGSREHKEKGVEVGANAYIVKGGFDQDDLLEAVRRLV
ncbi:MAG: response regulator [Burkholderiaceae bacterium]